MGSTCRMEAGAGNVAGSRACEKPERKGPRSVLVRTGLVWDGGAARRGCGSPEERTPRLSRPSKDLEEVTVALWRIERASAKLNSTRLSDTVLGEEQMGNKKKQTTNAMEQFTAAVLE